MHKEPFNVKEVRRLHVKIGHLRIHMRFKVDNSLAADKLLRTLIVDENTRNISLAEHRFVPWYSQPVSIIVSATTSHNTVAFSGRAKKPLPPVFTVIERYRQLKSSKAVKLTTCTHTPMLPTGCDRITIALESLNGHGGYIALSEARCFVMVDPKNAVSFTSVFDVEWACIEIKAQESETNSVQIRTY